jgi:hypothetical protein
VRGGDRSRRRSGVGWWAAAARPPRAAVEAHPAVGWRRGRPVIARAGGGREIRRRKPRLHLRRGTARSALRKGRQWRRLDRVHGPASHVGECDKRGRGLGARWVRSRDARPSGRTRLALEWPAEVDWMGLVRSARGERLESGGPRGGSSQISGLRGGAPPVGDWRGWTRVRREEWKPSR